MTAAIYYHPEAYSTGGPKLMGRQAAGESFIRAFLQYAHSEPLWLMVEQQRHIADFDALRKQFGRGQPVKAMLRSQLNVLSQPGCVYYPGPGLAEHAFQRSFYGHAQWSVCGITHTTASAGVMDAITGLLTAPVQPWDALICTSQAVKANVQRLLELQIAFLKDRLDIRKVVMPQLPVIPLGVHCADFVSEPADKAMARAALGIPSEAVVVLFLGRLSFHAKAHPLPMYQAMQQVAKSTGKPLVLLECGWFANAAIEQAFVDGASQICPDVRAIRLDGRLPEARTQAWAAADIFCSLSDNIQETFGITPVEAMAAGLPVLVSDWDGYRDTLRDGVDGFRIPTVMPPAPAGLELAHRHALGIDNYDQYCGNSCAFVAVDIPATTNALQQLVSSPALRQQMGQAGRARALEVYDWQRIIPQYEDLWQTLAQIRQAAASRPTHTGWPARSDPFDLFVAYPSRVLAVHTRLQATMPVQQAQLLSEQMRRMPLFSYAAQVLPSQEEVDQLLQRLAGSSQSVQYLLAALPPARHLVAMRGVVWLLKLGLLKLADAADHLASSAG